MELQKTTIFNIFFFLVLTTISFSANAFSSSPPESNKSENEKSTLTLKYDKKSNKVILNSFNSEYSVQIFDTEGGLVTETFVKKNKKAKISTKRMKPGNYYVRYIGNSEKNNSVEKLIIE